MLPFLLKSLKDEVIATDFTPKGDRLSSGESSLCIPTPCHPLDSWIQETERKKEFEQDRQLPGFSWLWPNNSVCCTLLFTWFRGGIIHNSYDQWMSCSFPRIAFLSMVASAVPSSWMVEAEGSIKQDHPWLHSEFKTSLGYRPCLKTATRCFKCVWKKIF